MRFEIPGRMPGLNEIIDAAKHMYKYQPYANESKIHKHGCGWRRSYRHMKELPHNHLVRANRHRDPTTSWKAEVYPDGLWLLAHTKRQSEAHTGDNTQICS